MENREWFFYPPPAHPADPGLPTAADLTAPPGPAAPAGPGDFAPAARGLAPAVAAPPPPAAAEAYPRSDLDRPDRVGGLSGSFWAEAYDARAEFRGMTRGLASAWRRAVDALGEASASVAVDSTPLRRVVEWTPVVVRESALRASAARAGRFGSAGRFGEGRAYGGLSGGPFRVAIAPFDDAPAVLDSPGAAAACWVRGVDYEVEAGELVLEADPFESPGWSPEPVLDARGEAVDRELTLWLWRARRDDRPLARSIGPVLGVDLPSTPAAKALASAALDALAAGPTGLSLRRLLAAACDAPLCGSDGEAVEAVGRDAAGPFVVTSAAAYRLPPRSSPVVRAGDVLEAGDPLCDAVLFDPLGPAVPAGLAAFAPPAGLLPPGPGVAFAAGPTPVRLAPAGPPPPGGGPGPLHASWALGGGRAEAAFWAEVRRRERASGVYAADRLAGAPEAGPHAAAGSVPATVDPLGLLFGELLRGCGTLARLRPASFGPDALGRAAAALLRALGPAHEAVVATVEAPDAGSAFAPGPGADAAAGVAPASAPASSSSAGIPRADAAFARPYPDAS